MVRIEVSHQDTFFRNWNSGEEFGNRLCPAWGVEVEEGEGGCF